MELVEEARDLRGDFGSSVKRPVVGDGGCEVDDRDDELTASSFRFGDDALLILLAGSNMASACSIIALLSFSIAWNISSKVLLP